MRPTSKQKIGPKPFFLQFFPDYITNPHFLGEGKENCGGFFTGIRVFWKQKTRLRQLAKHRVPVS